MNEIESVAVCSRSFSKNEKLRQELERRYKHVKFNDKGLSLSGHGLVDFLKGAEKVVGQPFAKSDNKTRWSKISGTKDFWANLEWMPGAKRLWSFGNKYGSHILSAYSTKDSNCVPGKMKWWRKNLSLTQRSRIH